MEGRLAGGCVDCLTTLLGTRLDQVEAFNEKYKEDGIIWFLECCDLNVWGIRRAMWQMKEAGWFRYAKGFLIGRPYCIGQEMMGLDHIRAVTDILGDLDVPIILDADLGHHPPMMPLVSGSMAVVKQRKMTFGFPWNTGNTGSVYDVILKPGKVLVGKNQPAPVQTAAIIDEAVVDCRKHIDIQISQI